MSSKLKSEEEEQFLCWGNTQKILFVQFIPSQQSKIIPPCSICKSNFSSADTLKDHETNTHKDNELYDTIVRF